MPTMLQLTCANCLKPFERKLADRNRSRAGHQKPGKVWRDFCCQQCFRDFSRNPVEVACRVCGAKETRSASQANGRKKFYCKGCRGTVTVPCSACGKSVTKWASQVRGKKNIYCDRSCKARGQRVPWDDLTRGMLKNRWVQEFGEESLVCIRCGHDKPFNIVIHHKVYVCDGGDNQPKNLEPLCLNCHGVEHYEHGADPDE